MTEESHTLAVTILEKEYRVSCPPGEEEALRASAVFLDKKMKEICSNGKTYGAERIAIMAALNISYELMQKTRELDENARYSRDQLMRLMQKVEMALDE